MKYASNVLAEVIETRIKINPKEKKKSRDAQTPDPTVYGLPSNPRCLPGTTSQ